MWSIIDEENLDSFLESYPNLTECKDEIILHKNKNKIFLPRLFYQTYPSKFIKVLEPAYNPEKINLSFNGEPRKNQVPLIEKISDIYTKEGRVNGIIKCFCGFGKTACSIYLATKIGLKTLFIVDKSSLYKQWIQEISKFTNISPDDIGIIQGKHFHVENKPFVVATVQTLLSLVKRNPTEAYEKMKRAGFGLVVYDECHNTSASEQYAKSSILMSAPNILGLSATPFKSGGQAILMRNVMGDILYSATDYKAIPEISFHSYQSGLTKYRGAMMRLGFIQSKAFYNKIISGSPKYLKLITRFVQEDQKKGHRTIIICWTEKQLQAISDQLSAAGIEHRQFYGKKREFTKDDKVLVATFKYAGTGFD